MLPRMSTILRDERGAIDLMSVLVGILVLGVMSGLIAATVFATIPWAQNNNAKSFLQRVIIAEKSYAGLSSTGSASYADLGTLESQNWFSNPLALGSTTASADGNTCIILTGGGTGYRAEEKSASGTAYYITDLNTTPTVLTVSTAQCLNLSTIVTAPAATYSSSQSYWTELSSVGSTGAVSVLPNVVVKSSSASLTDWKLVLPRTQDPFSEVPGAVTSVNGLPSWASVTSDSSNITIYNNVSSAYAQVSSGQPLTLGTLRFAFTPVSYGSSQTVNTIGASSAAGTNTAQADITVSLTNTTEPRLGFWSTDVDVTSMSTYLGQNGAASLNAPWASQGFTLTQRSGNIYTLSYVPGQGVPFLLTGSNVSHPSSGGGVFTLSSILRFTGNGKVNATVTAGATSGSQYYGTEVFNIAAAKPGAWGPNLIDLTALKNLTGKISFSAQNTDFSLTAVPGDTTGTQWYLSFNGTYQSPTNVTIQTN